MTKPGPQVDDVYGTMRQKKREEQRIEDSNGLRRPYVLIVLILFLRKSVPTAKHRMNNVPCRSLGTSSSPGLYDPAARSSSEDTLY